MTLIHTYITQATQCALKEGRRVRPGVRKRAYQQSVEYIDTVEYTDFRACGPFDGADIGIWLLVPCGENLTGNK